jgi:hypothetical protein
VRESELPGIAHIHFNGASGNVAAGKYNDGSPANRPMLAARLADGMSRAWQATKRTPLKSSQIQWKSVPVQLPLHKRFNDAELLKEIRDSSMPLSRRMRAARDLSWTALEAKGRKVELHLLECGDARVIHMPGELFVEYQLAAKEMRPDKVVAMAAYGDFGPGYIGTSVAYPQGGYETGIVSRVAPEVEQVLLNGMRSLLAK